MGRVPKAAAAFSFLLYDFHPLATSSFGHILHSTSSFLNPLNQCELSFRNPEAFSKIRQISTYVFHRNVKKKFNYFWAFRAYLAMQYLNIKNHKWPYISYKLKELLNYKYTISRETIP